MGLSSKKQKTTEQSTSTQNITTQRTNPAWVEDSIKGFTGNVTGLLNQDPTSFVAPANGLQTSAASAAGNLGGWRAGADESADLARQAAGFRTDPGVVTTGDTGKVGGSSLLEGLDSYMNPYLQKVVDTTLADFDVDAGRTRAAQAASGARAGAFGGSRFGVREAQTEGELARARSATDAGLRSEAFNTGAALSGQDADRRQQAALANQSAEAADLARRLQGDTGNAERALTGQTSDAGRGLEAAGLMGELANLTAGNARDDIGLQMDAGGVLRDIDTETRQAPIGLLDAVGNLLGQGQFDMFGGQTVNGVTESSGTSTTTKTGSIMDQIGKAVQIAAQAAAMSDERLKTDVETLGFDDRGRRWVSWRYLWEGPDAPRHTGVMAQEIAATDPDAVVPGPMGFLMVDYSKLEGSPWLHS